jgi:hypothetical protein
MLFTRGKTYFAGLSTTLLSIGFLTAVPLSGQSQTTASAPKQLNSTTFQQKAKLFLDYDHDFRAFAKAHNNENFESLLTMDLDSVSAETYERLDSTSALLSIYEALVCKEDRASALPVIKAQLRQYLELTAVSIDQANNDLAYVTSTATAQLGLRMKEDLQEVKIMLDSIERSIR